MRQNATQRQCPTSKFGQRNGSRAILDPSAETNGTYRFDEVAISPASIVRRFGKGSNGDGYKVSRQWVFRKGDLVFTVYDWKSTGLYESGMWSPDELWACKEPFDLHVGSKFPATERDVAEFIAFLQEDRCNEMNGSREP